MNKEINSSFEREKANLQVEEAVTSEQVQEFFNFADPLLGVDWGSEGQPPEYSPEFIASHPESARVFIIRDANGQIVAGEKTKTLEARDKERLGFDQGEFANQKGTLFEYAAIAPHLQNQGIIKRLMEKSLEWAKDNNSEFVCSEAEINNPRSVYIQMRAGFVCVGINEAGEGVLNPYFVLLRKEAPSVSKHIEEETANVDWKEVIVDENSFDNLKILFAEGWIGVDIKGDNENETNLGMPWTLIMEKKYKT